MRTFSRFRPSPALVVASVALLVALGGTSIAAVSVTLPRNSVGTAQLKKSAVTSAKLKNKAVTSSKLANNVINSNKVQNRTLLAADFAPGQIPAGPQGPQGPAGPAGPQGPAGVATPGYVAQVVAASGVSATTNSTSYADLSGSSQTIAVPTGETARFVVTFSASSRCTAPLLFVGSLCRVRVTVDGAAVPPTTVDAFDTALVTGSDDGAEAAAIIRATGTLPAGNHTVAVQTSVSNAGATFTIYDWSMVVDRVRLS